ncbi:MAG: CDP-glycerol glycerophosphotransferase family protein [Oscillospiraceae bacterium]|nr:CDP-glycerol glycerophosphotransferase family protein [Oscillospiraceae bacterium]
MKKLGFAVKQYLKMFVQRVFLPAVYNRHRKAPIEEKLVLFADGHNDRLPIHMERIYDEMRRQGYDTVQCVSNFGTQGFTASLRQMVSFMELYAKAKYVFLCDYYLPVSSCDKRPETKVIQLWHAGGMLKKFGYDSPDDIPPMYRGKMIRNYDLVTVSAPKCVPAFASAMGLPQSKVEPLGISRTDCFFDEAFCRECKAEFYRQYPELTGKRLILWAPTFRGNAGDPIVYGMEAVEKLQEQLGDDWFVLRKLHPHAEGKLHGSNCTIPTHRLLTVVDLLITDFSSIIFDYSLLDKPAVMFAPDYDEYVRQRGFYMDFRKDIPYPLVTEDSALYEAVLTSYHTPANAKTAAFRQAFMGSCDGNATARILKRAASL